MQTKAKKRWRVIAFVSTFFVLALALALCLTFLGSADEPSEPIQNYAAFPAPGASLSNDTVSLKFYFTVNTLNFDRAGFVFSETNTNPTVYGSGCTLSTTTVAKTYVTIDGVNYPAPTGRWWIEVDFNNVPRAKYTTVYYINAFMEDENSIVYGGVSAFYACHVCGHVNLQNGKILTAPTATDPGWQQFHCDLCGDFEFWVDQVAYYTEIANWQAQIANFSNSDFGSGSITTNLGNGTSYTALNKHPTLGQHPRVMFNASDIPGIRTALENAPAAAKNAYYVAAFDDRTWGELGPAEHRDDGFHNFDGGMLNKLQMLALDYQLTGNKANGYLAIYALKNYLKRMDFQRITGDQCRQFGFVMYNAACVYDWCHDLLTATDKQQIVLAIQKKVCSGSNQSGKRMEVGFPPSGQNAVSGHGCEFQILRDYLAFAIAIYDEYPGWWNYIANRVYNEFVPVRNTWYQAGMVPQGASLYVRIRFTSDLFSALLLKAATGEIPYDVAGMQQVMRTVYSYELPSYGGNRHAFESGDNHTNDRGFQDYGRAALLSSHLFNDSTMRKQLQDGQYSYSKFNTNFTVTASVGEYLICSSGGVQPASNAHAGMPKILYNGGWLGQMIARDAWDSTQAATLMKIGVRTGANHDHADAGQFQIWYKGMLAGDTGTYDTYDRSGDTDPHFMNYHQATIAHNSLLIKKGTGTYNVGGQKQPGEAGSYSNWMSDTYKTGTVTGYAYGYSDQAQNTPAYAYIAGNITPAYDNNRVTEVTRRMLTVFDTADSDEELYFFVFDNITATSGSYKKTFLLHVPTEPTISGNTITVVNENDAKLVVQNVFGGDTITKIGGTNNNYNVNGSQVVPSKGGNDGYWGRVEISPNTGSATNQILNVMYVCDDDDPNTLTAVPISNSTVKGAVLGNTAAVFVTSATRRTTSFNFTASGSGTLNYYVSGVAAGGWAISVNGVLVGTTHATEDGGLATFTAPAGTVTLVPFEGNLYNCPTPLGENGWPSINYYEVP